IRFAKANNCDIVITGHTHVKVLEEKDGVILLNPGSPSIPKDGVKSVAIIDDDEIKLIDTDSNKVLSSLKI
ncbi:MAG: metallophosphoesterase family protein, partial [Finegoldia magna]|nr:metallophosphoesterase family protein [Finegoldia magna]